MNRTVKHGVFRRPDSGALWIRYSDGTGKIRREVVSARKLKAAGIRIKDGVREIGVELAESLLRARKATADRGDEISALHTRKVKFGELVEDAIAHCRSHNRGYKTDESRLGILRSKFGELAAESIPVSEFRRWMDDQGHWSIATKNRYRSSLSLVYRLGFENGKVKVNPARMIKQRTEPNHRLRWLSDGEETALRKVIGQNFRWHEAEFTIAVNTGMRPSEQFGLRWADVDLERRQIGLLVTKTGRPRFIPINSVCLAAFKELQARPIQREYCFLAKDGERLIGHRWFEDAAKQAGLQITWYEATRHTFASRLAMAGSDIRTIADLMGHRTIQMSMRYAHLSPSHTLAAVERLVTDTFTDTRFDGKKTVREEALTLQ